MKKRVSKKARKNQCQVDAVLVQEHLNKRKKEVDKVRVSKKEVNMLLKK